MSLGAQVRAVRLLIGCFFIGALSMLASVANAAPEFIGRVVTAPIPNNADAQATVVHLRRQEALAGQGPIQVSVEQIFLNERVLDRRFVSAFGWNDSFGAVCLGIMYPGFTPGPNDVIRLALSAVDQAGDEARTLVQLVNGFGPVIDPENEQDMATCADGADTPNVLPTAVGLDQDIVDDEVPGALVRFDASGSRDPDGRIVLYTWATEAESFETTQPVIERTLPRGDHVFTLSVTDDRGGVAFDEVRISIRAPEARLVANAGPDQSIVDSDGSEGERSVDLDGSASNTSSQIETYRWTEGGVVLATTETATIALTDGVHTITLTVTDVTGVQATDTVVITVQPPRAPTANAGADQSVRDTDGRDGETVRLTGTGTDPDGAIVAYEWFLGDAVVGRSATVDATLPNGINELRFIVTDNVGLTGEATVRINVAAPASQDPQTPTANAGADLSLVDADGLEGEVVTLNGSGTDADGAIARYEWFVGNTSLGIGATLVTRIADGVSVVTLVVTDDSGLSASDSLQISVAAPVLPVVNAGVARSIEDSDLQPGENVQLTGSATTQSGTIAAYEWSLGEEVIGNAATITARLPDGVNVVTLRVTTSLNLVGTASVQITVGAPVRTVLADLPGLTANERRLAVKLDQACASVLEGNTLVTQPMPNTERPSTEAKRRPPTAEERADFVQKCRGLVYSRNTAALVDAVGELLGDDFAVARTQTLLFANTQYASVMDRLIALRGGARGLSLAGLNIVVDGELIPLAELQDFAKMLLGGGASSDADNWGEKWGLWMRGNYSFGSKDDDGLSPSFDADQYALLAGLDYRFSSNVVAGLALAYGNSTVEFNPTDEGGLDTENWAISLYGSVYAARNMYFDAILNVADASYEARRNITYVDGFGLVNEDAKGDTGGLTLSGGVSGGYDFLLGGLTLSPTLGVFYIDAQIDDFTESGAGGLNLIYDEQRFKSLTGNLGLRATFAWNLSWGVLLPHLRADFVREFEDDVDVFGIRFAADPNAASTPPILVETENPDTSYWRFAGGFSAQFKYGISGYVEYQRLESFQAITFQDVSLGLRFQRSF